MNTFADLERKPAEARRVARWWRTREDLHLQRMDTHQAAGAGDVAREIERLACAHCRRLIFDHVSDEALEACENAIRASARTEVARRQTVSMRIVRNPLDLFPHER